MKGIVGLVERTGQRKRYCGKSVGGGKPPVLGNKFGTGGSEHLNHCGTASSIIKYGNIAELAPTVELAPNHLPYSRRSIRGTPPPTSRTLINKPSSVAFKNVNPSFTPAV